MTAHVPPGVATMTEDIMRTPTSREVEILSLAARPKGAKIKNDRRWRAWVAAGLEERGLVTWTVGGRFLLVTITPAGKAILDAMAPAVGQRWTDMDKRLGPWRIGEIVKVDPERAGGPAALITWESSGRSTWVSVFRLKPPCYSLEVP